jgi:hypothetical protein
MDTARRLFLVALFPSQQDAVLVVDQLRRAGFPSRDVSLHVGGVGSSVTNLKSHAILPKDCRGAIKGMIIGGISGFLVGAIVAFAGPTAVSPLTLEILATGLGFCAAGIVTGGMLGAIICREELPVAPQPKHACTIITVCSEHRTLEAVRILGC